MVEAAEIELVQATQVARQAAVRQSANGVCYAFYGALTVDEKEVEAIVQAVPLAIAGALKQKAYYFVPLTIGDGDPPAGGEGGAPAGGEQDTPAGEGFHDAGETLVAAAYSVELSDRAICHRNVVFGGSDCVFLSTRLMPDKFALAFEFFINVARAFVDAAGVPESFGDLAWSQALADVRGDTGQDAWESRRKALGREPGSSERTQPARIDEKAKTAFFDSAFADAVAIYLLSLTVDFDYADLREREYPLLAAPSLADRLRLVAGLFPPNAGYEFSILYRRKS